MKNNLEQLQQQFINLKRAVDEAEKERIRAEVVYDESLEKLKHMGFSSVEEAETKLKELTKQLDKKQEDVKIKIKQLENLIEENLYE